jgi:hypothetical protein
MRNHGQLRRRRQIARFGARRALTGSYSSA